MSKEEVLSGLAKAVVEGDVEKCKTLAKEALNKGIDAYEAIMNGCSECMNVVSDKYETGEMFVPEILASAEAMYAAIEILKPQIKLEEVKSPGRVVIGVVQGDIHDIGKNFVKLMLGAAGFEIIDSGRDVPPEDFIEKVSSTNADICAISALMSTSMVVMPEVIEELKKWVQRPNQW